MRMFDYEILCVEETRAPMEGAKGRWHRYIIANRTSRITGYRTGSKKEVAAYASQCVERLNNRHMWRLGHGEPHPFSR
jgi:hypothetical protein